MTATKLHSKNDMNLVLTIAVPLSPRGRAIKVVRLVRAPPSFGTGACPPMPELATQPRRRFPVRHGLAGLLQNDMFHRQSCACRTPGPWHALPRSPSTSKISLLRTEAA